MTGETTLGYIPAGDLPGTLRKVLVVPEGDLALLVEGAEVVGRRGPGEHRLGNWPRPAPDALLLPQRPFDLRPRLQRLGSGDGQPFDLVWPLTVQVADPARFYTGWLAAAPEPEAALRELEDHLAGLLWDGAQEEALRYALDDLQLEAQVQSALARPLRGMLAPALDALGLALVGSQRPQPRTLEDDRAEMAAANQMARAARDARFEAVFERLEDRDMLRHRLHEWAAAQGQEPPDEALVDLLWQEVEGGPDETSRRAQQAVRALERQVTSLRLTLQGERTQTERRFRQMLTRLEGAEKAAAERKAAELDPADLFKRLLFLVRLVGTGLTLAAGLLALLAPQLDQPYRQIRIAALIATTVMAAMTLIADLFLRRKVRQVRQAHAAARLAAARAGLEQRRQADRLVRSRIEAGVKQVADNLEAAWRKGYDVGGGARDLAVELRETARAATHFGEQEVRIANYHAGRYLSGDRVPDGQLAAVLDLDDDLLARSRRLAGVAESLFEQVNAGQVAPARAALRELENGLNALRNRFTERGAYLIDPH